MNVPLGVSCLCVYGVFTFLWVYVSMWNMYQFILAISGWVIAFHSKNETSVEGFFYQFMYKLTYLRKLKVIF